MLSALVRSVKWSTSPWYLFTFTFTKSSMPCLSSSASPSTLKMKWVILRWKKDTKRKRLWVRKIAKERRCEWERTQKGDLDKEKGGERNSATKEECKRKRWREQEKWGDKKRLRGRCNPNYRPDFKFHPTFGWNYFLSNKRDVNMTLFVGSIFCQKKDGYLMMTTSRSWMNFWLWKNTTPFGCKKMWRIRIFYFVEKYNSHSSKKMKSKDTFFFGKKTLSTFKDKYMTIRINFFCGKKIIHG